MKIIFKILAMLLLMLIINNCSTQPKPEEITSFKRITFYKSGEKKGAAGSTSVIGTVVGFGLANIFDPILVYTYVGEINEYTYKTSYEYDTDLSKKENEQLAKQKLIEEYNEGRAKNFY
jgi:hypothetical protein